MFGSVLRQRWLWYEWANRSKPWVGTQVPCSPIDRAFFEATTIINIGDGSIAKFWKSRWLQGMAPADIAPGIFQLVRWKNISVKQGLGENRWIRSLREINTEVLVQEFLRLWLLVREVVLVPEQVDCVAWRWTADGN
jgi:hypothetical protein